MEANQIVRFLFDSGFNVKQIYYVMTGYQALYLIIVSVLWGAFLKAYPVMIKNMPQTNIFRTMLVLFAGPKATFFDFVIGKVDAFYFMTSITPIIVSLFLYRWYLGLEWLDVVPISRFFVPLTIFICTMLLYTYISYRKKH